MDNTIQFPTKPTKEDYEVAEDLVQQDPSLALDHIPGLWKVLEGIE